MRVSIRKLSAIVLCGVFAGLGVVASGCLGPSNQKPVAVINATMGGNPLPSDGVYATQTIDFDGNASKDPDGSVKTWSWEFGDTQTGTGAKVAHSYASPNEKYTVKLTVTDDKGETGSATLDVKVKAAGGSRNVTFRMYPPNQFVGNDVSFDGCDSQDLANAEKFHWTWGDSKEDMVDYKTATDCMAKHKYDAKGAKSVKLSVHYKDAGVGEKSDSVVIMEKLTGKNATTYVISTPGEPESFDPAYDYETAGVDIIENTYETLYFYDGKKADVFVPLLASANPTISTDSTEYTIPLRKGVKFFSGAEMKADDVVFSLSRVVVMAHPAGPSWMLEQVTTGYIGQYIGQPVSNWSSDADGWGSVPTARLVSAYGGSPSDIITVDGAWKLASEKVFIKVDDYTVKIKLDRPYPAVIPVLAFSVGAVTEAAVVKQVCGFPIRNHMQCTDVPGDGIDTYTPAGTGPFQVAKGDWKAGVSITMKKNVNWWMAVQKGYTHRLDEIVQRFDGDLNTRVQLLKNGDADTATIGYRDKAQVEGDANLEITKDLPTFVINIGGMNQNIKNLTGMSISADFFADLNVRKGFAYTFNYKGYMDNCIYGGGKQAQGPIPEGMFGFKKIEPPLLPTYDLNKAKEFFQKTKWWNSGFWIQIQYNAGNTARKCASDLLKASLESLNTNFHANVTAFDWPTYLGKLNKKELAFFWLGWAPDYADPDDYAQPFMRSTGLYPGRIGYKNATVDQLVDDGSRETDLVKRAAIYNKIQEAAFYDQPFVWENQGLGFHVERTWVEGWYYNPMILSYYAALSKGST